MLKKIKAIWAILTGNSLVGFLSVGVTADKSKNFLLFTASRAEAGKEPNWDETIIVPENTIAYIPKLTEGRIENPKEYIERMKREKAAREDRRF